jgi:negative regulator of flagellin synthesis FlgM
VTNPIQNSSLGAAGSAGARTRSVDTGATGRGAAAAATGGSAAAASADTVSISQSARALNAAAAASVATAPPAQIAQLKDAIASGQYQVDAQKIARGLLSDSRALQNGTQRRG